MSFSILPLFLAWEAFKEKNGTPSLVELRKRINKYKKIEITDNTQIGCTILTEPFWFNENEWIPAPQWSSSIVKGKTFTTETDVGKCLYNQVQERIPLAIINKTAEIKENAYYTESVSKHRLGQGAFRVIVTDAYQRRCAITGEKTLPVLEAAHIIPYAENGPHTVTNGLLLKSDFHTLFDNGYITVNNDYHVEVSKKLYEIMVMGKTTTDIMVKNLLYYQIKFNKCQINNFLNGTMRMCTSDR